ncbi:CtIP-like endonuclease [Schizosaccharomyces cryophilus OY26]|uniref:CtIP-like endonuclease n=1 Tax=Schizosaccharomyces cryophilus (strain OY26 / ATCC MYA-4695 / CBS 11777 / NBRC 106824 / NRRL Y48691) TaxID=653667 RepID=S9X4T5_SCHCR|nr:CtIP-like endonuclease [Schizosaccharomyces cryophilus OY26]EPY52092.1 CtIP-like endonuclease [Schizosaccharomyces cryophilus OY26]
MNTEKTSSTYRHWSSLYHELGNAIERLEEENIRLKTELTYEQRIRAQLEQELSNERSQKKTLPATKSPIKTTAPPALSLPPLPNSQASTTEEEDEIPGSETAEEDFAGHEVPKQEPMSPKLPFQSNVKPEQNQNISLSIFKDEPNEDTILSSENSYQSSPGEARLQARAPEDMALLRETQPLAPLDINSLPQFQVPKQPEFVSKKKNSQDEFDDVVRGKKRKALPAFDCPDCEKFYKLHGPIKDTGVALEWNDENRKPNSLPHTCPHSTLVQKVGRHRRLVPPKRIPDGFWESDFVD